MTLRRLAATGRPAAAFTLTKVTIAMALPLGQMVEEKLLCTVTVGQGLLGFMPGIDASLDAKLRTMRAVCASLGLTGAVLTSHDGVALILEGSEASLAWFHRLFDINPSNGSMRQLDHVVCVRRRFGGWPLAYVAPSRWLRSALGSRPLAEMTHYSPRDAKFLIELVLDFVGQGP